VPRGTGKPGAWSPVQGTGAPPNQSDEVLAELLTGLPVDPAALLETVLRLEPSRGKFQDRYTRRGYWIENGVLAALEDLAAASDLSVSQLVNRAIAHYLAAMAGT
jgi:hypothetical protein